MLARIRRSCNLSQAGESAAAGVACGGAQLVLNAQQLIVFGEPFGARQGTGFYLPATPQLKLLFLGSTRTGFRQFGERGLKPKASVKSADFSRRQIVALIHASDDGSPATIGIIY